MSSRLRHWRPVSARAVSAPPRRTAGAAQARLCTCGSNLGRDRNQSRASPRHNWTKPVRTVSRKPRHKKGGGLAPAR